MGSGNVVSSHLEVGDRALSASKGVTPATEEEGEKESPPFSPENIDHLFEKRFQEGYDVDDPEYRVG